jgi:hypothetical protein
MGASKSKLLKNSEEKRKEALDAKWMTAKEQEEQIDAAIERERMRTLREAMEEEERSRKAASTAESVAIDTIVQKYLSNEMINSPFIPDFIERRIYANIVKLVVGAIKETVESSNINVMGYNLSFNLKP